MLQQRRDATKSTESITQRVQWRAELLLQFQPSSEDHPYHCITLDNALAVTE